MSRVHVRIQVGGQAYALPVGAVLEIADVGDVAELPGGPAHVLGVRNLRGQVLPILDLAGLLGVARPAAPDGAGLRRAVVTEDAGRLAGLAVDAVVDVGPLPDATEPVVSPHLQGAALVDGSLVGVVDVKAVYDAVEAATLR